MRIWQASDDPERISVCAHRCPDPWPRSVPLPLGAIPLPLDDGHTPNGRYRYGDLTVATVPGNPGLLTDRVQLLRLRDTLAGTGTLDWDHDTPMTTWTGVTIGGTPPRVTKLQLANRGLNGELSGLLGHLTGLEELRLNGNALTGAIPSRVKLSHTLTGTGSRTASRRHCGRRERDVASLGLADCLPPIEVFAGRGLDRRLLRSDTP